MGWDQGSQHRGLRSQVVEQDYCKGISDIVVRHNNTDHNILKCALIGETCQHFQFSIFALTFRFGTKLWGWKRNHESWIIVTKHARIMNFCFKNLGIMNLCSAARESWVTRLWEKLNKIHVWINCVRSSECRIWRFRGSNFQKCFGGSIPPTPPV